MKFNPFYEIKSLLIEDPSDENLRKMLFVS